MKEGDVPVPWDNTWSGADGSVQYISNTIDCGDLSQAALDDLHKIWPNFDTAESHRPGRSPWGVWEECGSRHDWHTALEIKIA